MTATDPVQRAQGLIADAIAILHPVLEGAEDRLDSMKHLTEVKLQERARLVKEALDYLDLAHGDLIKILMTPPAAPINIEN
ncbi:hypothetical protein QIH85_24120 [Bradyrhizobium japonicum]|uniref:hypothetical protein n=1 Tax=Bradyrhizobium japonicum TaxID=375 RepID=UPI002715071D|nr:hypothetical protein [Bradyrhizobium japonicum]WLB24971.1 hypothetical protein QIH85_24120 [Bradyrhizobium japonicum]